MNEFCFPVEAVIKRNAVLIGRDMNVLDRGKLELALSSPLQTYGGKFLYPSVLERAAALLFSLAKSHAFVDGNKRTAWVFTSLYLELEGFPLTAVSTDEVVDLVVRVAGSSEKDLGWIVEWLGNRIE